MQKSAGRRLDFSADHYAHHTSTGIQVNGGAHWLLGHRAVHNEDDDGADGGRDHHYDNVSFEQIEAAQHNKWPVKS